MKPIDEMVLPVFLGNAGSVYSSSRAPIDNLDKLTANAIRRAIAAYDADEHLLAFVLMTDSHLSGTHKNRILKRWQLFRQSHLVQAER
jgi:hypothetical protein